MSTYRCCYKCEDRHSLCHSDCEKYLDFVKKNEECKKKMRKDDIFRGYRQESINRFDKYQRRHRLKKGSH